jgi:hypothetical protein
MQVHYRNDEYHFLADLVDQSVRKAAGSATPCTL